MEIENGAARGVLLPVLPGSEPFDNSILPPLQNMYMYEESKQSFRYNSAFLIKNTTLQERYEAFRTGRRGMGYSEEELEESYGFLLFDDKNKANKLGETGVIPGHSTCSTLGDPSKGVYVSKYSDCLDLNRWYHGKSGYIAIIRLTKGRVRDVTENYTVNYTPPSNGFDCHVSEQLSAVSANTSSFLAFERTQYYMYELPGGGADSTVQPPSHACPFAIVAFSYWDTKTPASEDQEKSEEEKTVFHYYPWRGQLQISSQVYHVGLKSSTGPLIPAKLPTVMAVDGAIKMSDLRQKLPKAMFETCFIGEVSLEGMGWSLYELAPSEAEDTSLSQLTQELKEKDLALVIQLNDSGFLILLHSSHFLTYEDAGSNKPEVLQGMFVFPDSRAIQRDTKICSKNPSLSPEGLQVVPALNYAETEVEKCLPEQSGELRGLLEQHIQSYAALIHPGLTISPSREASIFPDQFDVPDALKYLYSTPKWTEMGWKCLKSYFHQPDSFELSVSRATELLAAGREERGDEPDDDIYYCLSSPEGPPMTPASLVPSDLTKPAIPAGDFGKPVLKKADRVEDEGTHLNAEEVQPAVSQEELKKPGPALATKPNIKAVETGVEDKGGDLPKKEVQEEVPCDLSQFAVSANVFAIAGMTVMTKATEVTEVSTSPASGDLPTVLVITATEGTATVVPHNENFGLINTESITKNSSSLPPAKVQERGGSALNGQRGKANEVNNLSTSDWRKRPRKRRRFSGLGKRVLRSSAADFEEEETEKGCLDSSKVYSLKKRKEMTDLVQLNPWKKKERMDVTQVRPLKMQRELMNLIQDLPLKKKKESKDSMNFYPFKRKESVDLIHDGHPLKKKTDRWDLKAIISECGRIFVPHGSEVIAKDIESLKVMGKVIDHKQCADEMMVEACIKVPQPIETGDEPGLELIKSDENKDPHIWSSDSKDHPPEVKMADVDKMASQKSSELVQNKDMDFPSLEKHKKNSQFVAISLSKLKTVFSRRGKKKTPLKPVSEDQMLALDKKSKADAGMESVHFSHSCKDTPDRTTGAAEVAKEQTFGLDPKFALALGLTPRELHNNAPKSPEKSDIPLKQDIQSRLDLVTPQATSDQMSEALPSSPSATITLTGRGSPLQMKCKPADSIRKKWWLHYHTPTSFEKEKVAQPISSQLLTLNPDARRVVSRGRPRTVKKDTSDASCPPADALTLLADLALSTSNDKVLEQQPDHLALQQQECYGEPESVLHALLKHPSVARLKLPPQSPSPKGLVVGSGERVVLVSQEHSYSLPPSSSLLLGLSGSTLQVPISEGLQPHRKDMVYGDGTQALRAFLCQEQDQNRKELGKESGVAPESMRKGIGRRQKFRRLRRFIEKDRSVQVTRLWKENYDFNSDSKFTNDPMDKTVIRALHGPWDFNIEDTNEQVQLIIHMWIGLFYSRSTARFFQADPSLLCMEEKDSTEVDHGMVQAQVTSETKTSSPAYIALSKITEPEVLDRSNVGKKESQPLSLEPEALDLSVKTTSTVLDFTVDTKDSPESKQRIDLKSPSVYQPESGLHKEIISFHKQSTGLELKVYRDREDSMTSDKTSELDDDETNTHDNDSNGTLQNDVSPKRRNLESDGSYILLCEQAASVYINQEKVLETQIIDRGLEGKAKKEIQKEERSHDGEQNIARQDNDSVKTMSCTEVLGDGDLTNMADRVERNASEPRDGSYVAESKMHKAYPSVEDSVEAAKPEAVHVGKDTTNKEINAQPAGNDSIGKALKAMHDEKIPKDVSRVDGNSKNKVQTALQEGNDNGDEAQTALQEGNDNGDEAQTALQEGNDNGDEAQTALQEGNDNGDEALPAVNYEKESGDEAAPAVCGGNNSVAETPPEISHNENDSQKETPSVVHGGNDSTLPVKLYSKLYIDEEPTDEVQPMEQVGNVSVGTTRVLLEMQVEIKSNDEVLTTRVFPLCDGNTPFVGEEDISHTDVLHSHSQTSETVRAQIEIPFIGVELPFIGVETDSKDIMHTEVHDTPISSVCHSDNLFSGEMFRIVAKATESVSRCPTPIVDDGYIPIPDIDSGCLVNCNASGVGKPLSRCPTPTQDEPPFVTELSYDHHTTKTVFLPDSKDTNSPNLNSGFALIENEKAYCEPHEPSLGSSPSSVENMLHKLRKSSNNNSKPNNLEAIGNQFSQLWTEPHKKPIATSTPLNTPYTSSKEKNDYSPYSNMRLTPAEQDLYALSSHDSLHRFPDSYPKTHSTLTQKAAFSVPSTHLEVLSNDTTERILTRDLSEIALEGDTNLCPASTEIIIQSIRQNIPGVSGPTAASQNLSGPNFTEPHPYSQQLAMAVNLSKSEGSRGEYSWKEGQTNIDPMSSDVVKSKQTAAPVHSNTNPHLYNTPYVTEMRRQIASLQDYVMDESEEPAVEQDNIESSLETNWISDDQHASNTSQLNKTKLDFINSLREYQQWDKREFDDVLDFSKQGTSSSVTFQSEESDKIFTRMEENKQDWLKYCRSERSGNTSKSQIDLDDEHEEVSSFAKPCLVTVLDHKGNRITYENYPVLKPSTSTHTWTAPNSNRQGSSSFLEFSKRWDDTHNTDESDLTQSSVDLETLIFSERMNQMLKRKRKSSSSRSTVEERASSCSPAVTVHFSSLQEQESSEEHWEGLPSLAGQKLKIDMPERKGMPEETDRDMPQHLQKLSYTKGSEMTHVNVSDLVAESFKAYHAMMTEVCAGRKYPHRTERLKREAAKRNSLPKSRAPSKDKDFCGQMKKDMYDSLHDNLNSVVKQSCKNKFRFYILVTSDDPFFNETKELLEAEGHITVEQSQFCLGKDSPSSPLYIILRNEDIAEHICEVPHLLELKKSQNVLFAGIDRPDDIVNLTHQELFSKGGFVVFEGAALDTLSLSNIKKMSGFLEGLSKKGKWKWLLHYKDSRKLKESARSSAEAQGKKSFMDNCQEAGMVEVLPYHECDVISRTRPNYLHCLVRLQVQNVSARLPVFITDTTADKAFAKHGIFTMNINSFLLISQSDTCTIS
ncbi:unnamed protein product [Oncorhynchus mykiss]|uniref:Uncharacterized protein n=1 Tax=Oncorhynchus mykiss TaxID=8022 RepID=A0A060VTC6_ONCMY|nr:unnamed protein product [Oncorhynchus mykiss]